MTTVLGRHRRGRRSSGVQEQTLLLSYAAPYAVRPLLSALAAHAVPGLESTDLAARTHARGIAAPGGPATVRLSFHEAAEHVEVRLRLSDPADAGTIVAMVRRWLDLDLDPTRVDAALGTDPLLAPLLVRRPGLRVLGAVDGFESAAMTVLGQQVSLAAGRTFGARLVAAYGRPGLDGHRSFPVPEAVAGSTPLQLQATIGVTHARARALHGLSVAVAQGLHLDGDGDRGDVRRRLLAIPGIGPWTVDYLSVRVLGDRDAYPAGDLILKRALGVSTSREAAAMSEPWRPYRAYAVTHLWSHSAYA